MHWPRSCIVLWVVVEENTVVHAAKEEGWEGDDENELSEEGCRRGLVRLGAWQTPSPVTRQAAALDAP